MQGGLSRNKVAVGESAAGSPPKQKHTNQMPINRQNPQIRNPYKFYGFLIYFGLVDQLEDRCLCKAEALGSNPSKSIFVHPVSKLSGKDGLPVLTRRPMRSCIGAVY